MKIDEYITDLRRKDIIVSVLENSVTVKAPDGVLTPDVVEGLKSKKTDILNFFNSIIDEKEFEFIQPAPIQSHYPLSHGQMRLWILNQLKDKGSYNIPLIFPVGGLDITILKESLRELILRHEILRTVIKIVEGEPRQFVNKSESFNLNISHQDVVSDSDYEIALQKEIFYPFEINESVLKASLIKKHNGETIFVFIFHHIVMDAWSLKVLQKEFMEIYKTKSLGFSPNIPKLAIQYKDYAVWQNTLLETGGFENDRKYWIEKFSGKLPRLKLPIDFLYQETTTNKGTDANFEISNEISNQLIEFTKEHNVSLYMIFIGVLKSLFYRYTGQEDIIIGSVVSGRDHVSLKEQIGFYVNTIALRSEIKGTNSFRQILEEVKINVLDAFEHQSYPFDLLVNEVEQETSTEQNPLFDVLISFHDSDKAINTSTKSTNNLSLGEDVEFYDTSASKFDLSYTFSRRSDGGIAGTLGFNTELFSRNKIKRMILHFKNLLDELLNKPDEPIANVFYLDREETKILNEFNNTNKRFDLNKGIKHVIEARVKKSSTSISVLTEKGNITFDELNIEANRLAHYLKDTFKIIKGNCIGVLMDNTVDRLVTLLSIVKLGAIYVPLDQEYPFERSSYILKDTNAKVLMIESVNKITQEELEENLSIVKVDQVRNNINEFSSENPKVDINPEDIFSILFTSGSTGKPKGVLINNKGLLNRINWFWNHYKFSEKDIIYQKTPFVFDVSIGEIFMPLCFGAKLVLANKENNSLQVTENIIKYNITYTHFSPSQLNNYLDAPENNISEINSLRMIVCSGEELTKKILTKYYKKFKIPLSNLYGPTEASIEVTYQDTIPTDVEKKESRIPIGKPIDNVQIYILDKNHELLPIGVQGEIAIGGICLANGYLNSPEKTKQQFVDLKNIGKIYKTGDVGMWLEDGTVQFFGRKDNQISINGSRIELGEIESNISKHLKIHDIAVVPKKDKFDNWHLIAYYTLKNENSIKVESKNPTESKNQLVRIENINSNKIESSKTTNVYQLFEDSFNININETAIVFDGKTMSYKDLKDRVDELAALLQVKYKLGVGNQVVLIAGRSDRTIISILAILKIGAVYIPIDRDYPEARVNHILSDCSADLIIMDEDVECKIKDDSVPILWSDYSKYHSENYRFVEEEVSTNLTDLCYICYTSGSTGKPKGVMIEQHSVIDYIETFSSYFDLLNSDIVIQQSSISFDTSIEEIFPILTKGGKLIILPEGGRNIEAIIDAINQQKVTILSTTPLVINELNINTDRLEHIPRAFISGGDELRKSYINQLIHKSSIFNTYGPTEFTVCASFGLIDDIENCNMIGKPINNHEIYLFDNNLKEVSIGEIGEMYIVGLGMARGYLNNVEETEKYFIPHPSGEGLVYKTGDLAKYNEKGELEFCGRKDNQVKIKGYRVEPIEIDKALQKYDEIINSVSIARKDYDDNKHLVTYYKGMEKVTNKEIISFLRDQLPHYMVPDYLVKMNEFPLTSSGKIDAKALPIPESLLNNHLFNIELKTFVRKILPAYMIPSRFVLLDELPLTVSGKIDRKFLENKEIQKTSEEEYVAPENKVETEIQKIWENSLKLSKVSTVANFFEIGGNSIKATQIMAMIFKGLSEEISLKDIYNNPTILELARVITSGASCDSLLLKLSVSQPNSANIFFIPPILGSSTVFKSVALDLSNYANVYGLQYRGFDKDESFDANIKAMAKSFVQEIKNIKTQGQPIVLVGYSMGATVSFEITKILEEENNLITLVLIDRGVQEVKKVSFNQKISNDIIDKELAYWSKEIKEKDLVRIKSLVLHNVKILESHKLEGKVDSKIIAIEANQNLHSANMKKWGNFTSTDFEHHYIDASHYGILIDKKDDLVHLLKEHLK